MDNTKIIKSTKIIDKILKIVQGFMTACAAVCGIFVVLTLIFKEKIIADASNPELGNLTLHLVDSAVPEFSALKGHILLTLLLAIVMLAVGWYMIRILRSILVPMKDGRPFESGISARIRKLAWTSLIGGAVIEVCRMIEAFTEIRAYDFPEMLNSPAVESVTFNYTFNGSFIVIALVLLFLAHIFRYGECLQQESDETL